MTVRCRGTCKNDHTTEVQAEPGRVTWHGPCATDGCGLKVYCRRVPADTPAPPPDTRTAEPNPHRVLEVPGYRDEPAPADDDNAAGDLADDDADPPGKPASVAGQAQPPAAQRPARRRRPAATPAAPVTPTPPKEDRPTGALGRWRARLGDRADDADDEPLFGIY